jgi:2'-5' RNA ligase
LRFFGSVELEAAATALRSVSASPTTAVLGPETGRFGKGILHVPVDGLEGVANAVVRATENVGKPPEPRPFKGHLTLARARDRRRGVDLRPLVGTPIAAEWPVKEVCLVESRLSSKGANYEVVETVSVQERRTLE